MCTHILYSGTINCQPVCFEISYLLQHHHMYSGQLEVELTYSQWLDTTALFFHLSTVFTCLYVSRIH